MERDLAAARTAAMANGVGVKSRLQALQIAYVYFHSLFGTPDRSGVLPFHALAAPLSNSLTSGIRKHGVLTTHFIFDRYREQIDKVNRLKEDTVRAVIKNSSDIVAFKDEVSKQLQYLKDFAEAN